MGRLRHAACLLLSAVLGAACTRLPEVDGARARARVERQCAFGARVPGSEAHRAAAAWLEAELRGLGAEVVRQEFTDTTLGRPMALVNLIARFAPGRPARLLLCAHWDSRYAADRDPDPARRAQPVPGANDGASGVAVLLEVAEALARRPPPVGVDLVFFDGEDQGRPTHPEEFCLGARHYAARLGARRPLAAFLVDMVGDQDLQIHPERNSTARAANLVAMVLSAARATHARGFREEPRHTLYDDHMPLNEAGLPAVDIIDFDYPYWHTTADTPDKVSGESLAQVAHVLVWLVYRSPFARLAGG
jgi:acetylornithine deacetylase/succinyl-diaminopimelate desuccinylase-like protein